MSLPVDFFLVESFVPYQTINPDLRVNTYRLFSRKPTKTPRWDDRGSDSRALYRLRDDKSFLRCMVLAHIPSRPFMNISSPESPKDWFVLPGTLATNILESVVWICRPCLEVFMFSRFWREGEAAQCLWISISSRCPTQTSELTTAESQ
jgi:hypothetical protein